MTTTRLPASIYRCTTCKQPTYLPTVYRQPTKPEEPKRPEPPKSSLAARLALRLAEAEDNIDRAGKSEDDVARTMLGELERIASELRAEDAAIASPAVGAPSSKLNPCFWCGSRNVPRTIEIDPPHPGDPSSPPVASVAAPSAAPAPAPVASSPLGSQRVALSPRLAPPI
jgi:hypothetical protein